MAALAILKRHVAVLQPESIPYTVTLQGKLDVSNREETCQRLQALASWRFGIVDLSDVESMDAAFMGQLAGIRRQVRRHHGTVVLVAPTPAIRNALVLVRFDQLFPLCASIADAYAYIAARDGALL